MLYFIDARCRIIEKALVILKATMFSIYFFVAEFELVLMVKNTEIYHIPGNFQNHLQCHDKNTKFYKKALLLLR